MEINLDLYPKAKMSLIGEMLDRYGVDLNRFKEAPIYEQAKAIHQMFGYSMGVDINLEREELIDISEDILYFYESANIDCLVLGKDKNKNPIDWFGTKKLTEMFMSNIRPYLPTLKDCLVPIGKDYKIKTVHLLSLKDCLTDLLEPIPAKVDLTEFWDEAIKYSWKQEPAPF